MTPHTPPKIKIFMEGSTPELETQINLFLADTITYSSITNLNFWCSYSGGVMGVTKYYCAIYYLANL